MCPRVIAATKKKNNKCRRRRRIDVGRRGTDSDISRTHSSQPLISSSVPSFPRCRLIRSECWGYGTYFLFLFLPFHPPGLPLSTSEPHLASQIYFFFFRRGHRNEKESKLISFPSFFFFLSDLNGRRGGGFTRHTIIELKTQGRDICFSRDL